MCALSVFLASCVGSSMGVHDDGSVGDGAQSTPARDAADPCAGTSSSNLQGVSIAVHGPCTFTVAQARAGVSVPYEVHIQSDVSGVVRQAQDASGCGAPGASGLIVFEQLDGGGQRYCLCDTGRCAPPSQTPVTLHAGTYQASFAWDGVNWFGPSDTGNPKGPPFPPGTYALKVSATGTAGGAGFEVSATYPIILTP